MGHSIANNLASHGIAVHLYESFPNVRAGVKQRIREELRLMVEEGYFPESVIEETLGRIELFADLEPAVQEVDFVIEATPESLELKKQLFADLDRYCGPDVIFASNTSSLKLSDMTADLPESRKAKTMIA